MSFARLLSRHLNNKLVLGALVLTVILSACTGDPNASADGNGGNGGTENVDPGDQPGTEGEGDQPGQSIGGPDDPEPPAPPQDSFVKLSEPGVGGRITSLAFDPTDPNRLFVGGDILGIAVTDDLGETWQSTTGLASWEIGDITTSPSADGRIWTGSLSGPQSSSDGITWALSREGFPPVSDSAFTLTVDAILIDPNDSNRLLAFNGNQRDWVGPGAYRDGVWTGDGSVWESTDSGNTWSQLSTVVAQGNIRAAAHNADGSVVYAAGELGVFTSADGGATWLAANAGLPHANAYDVTAHPNDPATAWVSLGVGPAGDDGIFAPGGIWKTTDGGQNWVAANEGISIVSNSTRFDTGSFHQIVVAPTQPDRLFTSNVAPGQAAVYRSDDGGLTWQVVADGSTRRANAYQSALRAFDIAIHPADADRVAIGSDDALLGSIDGGETWTDLTTSENAPGFFSGRGYSGLVSTDIIFNPADPDDAILLGFDGGNFIQTIDGGASWRRTVQDISAWGGGVEAAYSPNFADRIYVLLGQFSNFRGIGVSNDGGASFELVVGAGDGLPEIGDVTDGATGLAVLSADGSDTVLAVVGTQLYRSTDGADSFSPVDTGGPARDVVVSADGQVFVTTGSGVVLSTDGGASFSPVADSPPGLSTLYSSASEPGTIYAVAFREGDGGAYRFDGTWTRIFEDRFSHGVAVDPTNPNNIAIVTQEPAFNDISSATGVYLSDDGGQTWTVVTTGLPMTRLRTAEFDPSQPDRLVVGTTGRGFYDISFQDALN